MKPAPFAEPATVEVPPNNTDCTGRNPSVAWWAFG